LYRYIPEFLQITGSFADEIYNPGETIELTWLSNRIENMKIEYAINSEDSWGEIEPAIDAEVKKYTYTIPFDIIPQEYYSMKMTIRISSSESPEIFDEISIYVEEEDLRESFVTFTPENSGVISKHASIIYEDRSGVMWFVSGIGVSRYDGSDWETFTTENSGLIKNDISSIYEDINGGIWFLSNEGVSGFDGTIWTMFTPENSGLISNYVNNMASTPDGSLWFGTPNGLSEFDGETWTTWFEGESIMYLAVGRNGRVFTLFHRFDDNVQKTACKWHSRHEWELVAFDGEKWVQEAKEYSLINVLGTDPDGYLWFNAFDDKMIKYDGISWCVNECPPEVFWINKTGVGGCFTWGSDGTIWIDNNERLYSFDGGEWKNYSFSASFYPGSMAAAPDGSVFCATYYKGIAVFDGTYWKIYKYEYGCPFYGIKTIFVDSKNVKWISCTEGLIRFDDSAVIPTKIAVKPNKVTVINNYPNPFNLSTTIAFSLKNGSFAKLLVYNIMGQKVRELISEYIPAGTHEILWDCRDDHGIPVSTGVYFTHLKADDIITTGKILLLK